MSECSRCVVCPTIEWFRYFSLLKSFGSRPKSRLIMRQAITKEIRWVSKSEPFNVWERRRCGVCMYSSMAHLRVAWGGDKLTRSKCSKYFRSYCPNLCYDIYGCFCRGYVAVWINGYVYYTASIFQEHWIRRKSPVFHVSLDWPIIHKYSSQFLCPCSHYINWAFVKRSDI